MIPGEYIIKNEFITLNDGRRTLNIKVSNTGDRPVQVGSHYHFFEVIGILSLTEKALSE